MIASLIEPLGPLLYDRDLVARNDAQADDPQKHKHAENDAEQHDNRAEEASHVCPPPMVDVR